MLLITVPTLSVESKFLMKLFLDKKFNELFSCRYFNYNYIEKYLSENLTSLTFYHFIMEQLNVQ